MRKFVTLIIIVQFFTPIFSLFHRVNALFIIFPYVKNYIVAGLIISYFVYTKLIGKTLFLPYRKDKLFSILIFFLVYLLIDYFYVIGHFNSFKYIDSFPLTSLLFGIFIFVIYSHKVVNLGSVFNSFIKLVKIFQVLLFVELVSTFFISNPYSFSSYNGAFVSVFILSLNVVSIITNLAFSSAFYSLVTSSKDRIFNYFILVISFVVCYFTYNRTALLLDVIIAAFILYSIYGITKSVRIVIFFILLIWFINTVTPFLRTANINKQNLTDTYTLYLRVALAYTGFKVLLSNWILGVGPFLINNEMSLKVKGLFNDPIFGHFMNITHNTTLESGLWITHPHIAFLDLWLNFGVISIFFYVIIFKYLKTSFTVRKKNIKILLPLSSLLIIFVHNLLYPQLHLDYIIFFILVIRSYLDQQLIKNPQSIRKTSVD